MFYQLAKIRPSPTPHKKQCNQNTLSSMRMSNLCCGFGFLQCDWPVSHAIRLPIECYRSLSCFCNNTETVCQCNHQTTHCFILLNLDAKSNNYKAKSYFLLIMPIFPYGFFDILPTRLSLAVFFLPGKQSVSTLSPRN